MTASSSSGDAVPSSSSIYTIYTATTPSDITAVKALFEAYTTSLNLDLSFQDYNQELASLPGKYAPPNGCLLLARSAAPPRQVIGCVALRPLPHTLTGEEGCCEMKRLYVLPAGRGTGVGKALVERVLEEARIMGYRAVKLDTLESMQAAIKLYKALGFDDCVAYYSTPIQGTVFLEKVL